MKENLSLKIRKMCLLAWRAMFVVRLSSSTSTSWIVVIGFQNVNAEFKKKVCDSNKIQKHGYIDGQNLKKYANCTHIENNLILGSEVFVDKTKGIKNVDELYVLRNVKVVRGIIHIDLANSKISLTNLSFLENLEEVIEYSRENNSLPLQIREATNINFLGLRKLKKVSGGVWLADNPNLCFLEPFDWSGITKLSNFVKENKKADVCKAEGSVCDPNCIADKGCWGPGPTYCRGCKNVQHGHSCMESCPRGFYPDAKKFCQPCHSSCQFSKCNGPDQNDCKDTCNANEENCGSLCYRKISGECGTCSSKCYQGETNKDGSVCSGPGDYAKEGGCTLCSKIILHEGNTKDKMCLTNSEACPQGYYEDKDVIKSPAHPFAPSGKFSVCKPCYENCTSCTSGSMNYPECSSCQGIWVGRKCQKTCEPYLYYSIRSNSGPDQDLPSNQKQCLRCDSQCRDGCKDATPRTCAKCKSFRVYDTADRRSKFTCVANCPSNRPEAVKESNGEFVCLTKAPLIKSTGAGSGNSIWIIVGIVILILLLILLIIIGIIIYKKRKSKNQNPPAGVAASAAAPKNGEANNEEAKDPDEKDKLVENQDQTNGNN